jgi:hypothetical protein
MSIPPDDDDPLDLDDEEEGEERLGPGDAKRLLLEAEANRIARAAQGLSEDDYERQDAHDRLRDAVTAGYYAVEAEPDEDDEDSWARLDAITEHRMLTGKYLIDAGFTPERLPTRDDFELAAADATRMLNPPLGVVEKRSLMETAELMRWADAKDDEDDNEKAKGVVIGKVLYVANKYTQRQPTGRPNGRPLWGETRSDLIAARLQLGVERLWTLEELRECVRPGRSPRALKWRRTVLSLVVANMRDALAGFGGDKGTPKGIAEALKCSRDTVERLTAEGREARTRSPERLSAA